VLKKIIKPGMSVSAFFGSPRKDGYSSGLHEAVLSAACVSVRRFYLYEMNINPCLGCGECRERMVCVHNDDMNRVIESVLSSDILSFSFPLYFTSAPGPLKTMIDRFQVLWEASKRGECPVNGQTGIAFITAGSDYPEMFCPSKTILRHLMRSIEGSFNDEASIYCSGLDNDIGIESYRKIRTGILHKNEKN
jgi:multimeric flavodoxin WrbA